MNATARRKARQRARGYRAAHVAAGRRCDGRPRAARKPCGCIAGCCLKCRPRVHKGYYTLTEVRRFWRAYQTGLSAAAVERRFGLPIKGLKHILERRGFHVRPPKVVPKLGFGVRLPEPTAAEVQAAIRKLKFVHVPPELKQHWKRGSMAWRRRLLRKIRAHLRPLTARPEKPFSENVTPWEYGTPAAMAIARRMNAGRDSQHALVSIRASSQGVIWEGQLWFWTAKQDGTPYGYQGGHPRRLLHRVIYERAYGPIPAQHIVSHRDGNFNNLAPENLQLRSMAQNAIRNKQAGLAIKGEAGARVLLARFNRGEAAALIIK